MTAGIWFALALAICFAVPLGTDPKVSIPDLMVALIALLFLTNLVLSALAVGGVL